MDRGGRQMELFCDLANRRRETRRIPEPKDEVEDLALPLGQCLHQTNVRLAVAAESTPERPPEPSRGEEGLALFAALLMLAFLGLVGAAFLSSASVDTLIAGNHVAVTRLRLLAETGIAGARERMRGSPADLSAPLAAAAGPDRRIEASLDPDTLLNSDDAAVLQIQDGAGLIDSATAHVFLRNDVQDGPDQSTDSNGIVTLVSVARSRDWTQVLEADITRRTVPVASALTLAGPVTSLGAEPPGAFLVSGTDACGGPPVHAVGVMSASDVAALSLLIPPAGRTAYAGSGPPPDVADVTGLLPASMGTVAGLEALVGRLVDAATDRLASPAQVGNVGAAGAPRLVVTDGDALLGPGTGHGILLVRGEARVQDGFSWRGLVLVIGQGRLYWNAWGEVYGAVLVARTRTDPAPGVPGGAALPGLGEPTVDISRGTGAISWDACVVGEAQAALPFDLAGFRE